MTDYETRDRTLREGATDPELVHKARIAIRRLRSTLRTFAPMFDDAWARRRRTALRRLSGALSEARDADVQLARARDGVAELNASDAVHAARILEQFIAARDEAYARLRESARPRQLRSTAERPLFAGDDAVARNAERRVTRKAYLRLRKCVKRCGDRPTDAELHRVRIAAKHLRYALETFAPVCGRRVERRARLVKRLQDVLGEEHDAAIAVARLREFCKDGVPEADALVRREQRCARRARSRWRPAWRDVKEEF